MSSLTYTKRCIVEFSTVEGLLAHSNHVEYIDWFKNQVSNNLADPTDSFLPFKSTSTTINEMLCVNQSQAEELMAKMIETGVQLDHPLIATTILDFSDTVQSFKQDFSKVVAVDYHTVEEARTFFYATEILSKSFSWYHNEIVNYQADPSRSMLQYGYVSPTVCLHLVKDLEQAERFVEFEQQLAEEFNYSVTCNISDYSDTQTDFFELDFNPDGF